MCYRSLRKAALVSVGAWSLGGLAWAVPPDDVKPVGPVPAAAEDCRGPECPQKQAGAAEEPNVQIPRDRYEELLQHIRKLYERQPVTPSSSPALP